MGSTDGSRLRTALRVAASDRDYPAAVADVARLVWRDGGMSYEVDRFVAPFLTARHRPGDAEALYTLGLIYERNGVPISAASAFRAALAAAPGHRDAARRIAMLGEEPPELESFPDLPDLPDLLSVGDTSRPERAVMTAVSERSLELGMIPLSKGDKVADRYRIVEALGVGGYAVVFRAIDLALDDPLALKLFRPGLATPAELGRFKQELRLTRRLAHPNVVATYDFGTWNGLHFITMELLDGHDLGYILATRRKLPLARLLDLACQAFEGLGAAHDEGIIHRDVKPTNLFVLHGDRRLKVMDFGLATAHDLGRQHTRTGRIVGTPAYLAPERLEEDQPIDASVDLYAMGVVLYEALVGHVPFRRRRLEGLFKQILSDRPVLPKQEVSSIPDSIDELIMALLEKNPADRPSSCAEVVALVRDVLADLDGGDPASIE
jgi:hypothetical protein